MGKYETDAKVTDSQCGLRSYPLFFLQNMKFYSKKYDFEVEILIRLIWAGVHVKNIKIGATYVAPSDKTSHKHKINDRLRLMLLNLSLITVSLLTERTSPAKSAKARGL